MIGLDIFNVKRLIQSLKFLSFSSRFTFIKYNNSSYDNRKGIPATRHTFIRFDSNLRIRPKLPDYCASMQRFVWAQLVVDVTERVASERNRWTKRLWVGLNHAYLASIAGCCAAKYFCRQRAVGRHWNMTCAAALLDCEIWIYHARINDPGCKYFWYIYIFYCNGKRKRKIRRVQPMKYFCHGRLIIVLDCWNYFKIF